MGSRRSNEAKACEAVVRLLELRIGAERAAVRRPEDEPGETAKVDFHVAIGKEEYALEHTVIEAVEDEIENYEQVVVPIRDHLGTTFPDGLPGTACYQLQVPVDVSWPSGIVARRRGLDRVVNWIRKTVEAMDDETQPQSELGRSPYRADRQACAEPPGLGFKRVDLRSSTAEIRLRRWPDAAAIGRRPGSLRLVRSVADDLEEARRRRFHRAFSDKWPKLKQWGPRGARTVLVLEDDIVLADPHLMADEVAKLVTECDEAPDDIVLVETHADPWWVWVLKHEAPHSPNPGFGPAEKFPESELTELEVRPASGS